MNGSLEDSPPWAIAYSSFDDESASFGFRMRCKLYYVEVTANELGDWPEKARFLQLLQEVPEDIDAEDSLADLIWENFLPFITTLEGSDLQERASLSLQDFYGARISAFRLDGKNANTRFIHLPESSAPMLQLRPQIKLKNFTNADQILHVEASRLQIKPRYPEDSDIGSDTPAIVSLDGNLTLYFKATQDAHSFHRELRILQQLAEYRLDKTYRLPSLHSLVTYSNDPDTVVGVLLKYIDHEGSLWNHVARRNPSLRLKQKWYEQMKDTVRALHRYNIIWGDVKPDNVLIDRDQNAWIIDFGGGYNSGYVDEELMETLEGDIQGIERMREMLLEGREY